MTTFHVARLEGNTRNRAPISFREVWASIMTSRVKREWAFNRSIPAPKELLRARENQPFSKTFSLKARRRGDAIQADPYGRSMEELYCTTRRLPDGTYLGFVLNSACIGFVVPCFAAFEPSFNDPRLDVARLICGAEAGRLYVIVFYWLKSGGLNVVFEPLQSLSISKRNELRLNPTVYAFLPSDVPMLSVAALCPDRPSDDFVNARFENVLLSEDWYVLKVTDTGFQSACIFCSSRGAVVCDCPLPMKRRMGILPAVVGYQVRVGKTCWEEYGSVMSVCENRGKVLLNLIKAPDSRYAKVMNSSTFPFNQTVQLNLVTSECLQKHLRMTGRSVYATRTVLMPFRLSGGKRKSIGQPFSLEHVGAPLTMSSTDSNKPMTSLGNSSSSNEFISSIRDTRKRKRVAKQVANFPSRAKDIEKAWPPHDVDMVMDATTMVVNCPSLVTEVLSHKKKYWSASAGSSPEFKNSCQSQARTKVNYSLF